MGSRWPASRKKVQLPSSSSASAVVAVIAANTSLRRGRTRDSLPARAAQKEKGPGGRQGLWVRNVRSLDLHHVGSAGALRAVDHLEANPVALCQGPEALGADLGVVDEHVRPTLARQEAEALGLIEPLDGAFDHERTASLAHAEKPRRPRVHKKGRPPRAASSETPDQRQPAAGLE